MLPLVSIRCGTQSMVMWYIALQENIAFLWNTNNKTTAPRSNVRNKLELSLMVRSIPPIYTLWQGIKQIWIHWKGGITLKQKCS